MAKYSDETLIDGMRELASELGRKPKQKEMRTEGPYSINAYKRAFGSWNEAVKQAGFEPRQTSKGLDSEALLDALQELADDLDKTPTQSEVDELGEHSVGAYYAHFSSLNDAKRELGLPLNKENNVERVTVECAQCGKEIKRLPSKVEQAEYTFCSQECHYEHNTERYSGAGNPRYNKTPVECSFCGDEFLRANWEQERYNLDYCPDCWGSVTVTVECEWCGSEKEVWPSHRDKADIHFCDHECHGKWQSENRLGENHPRWNPNKEQLYYGPNWPDQRKKALERDEYQCLVCGKTRQENKEEVGYDLSVHHITPLEEYRDSDGTIDYETGNDTENLRTYCHTCHPKWEGIPVAPRND